MARLVELTERVVAAVDAAGLPLFAAWRAMPVPDDAPGARGGGRCCTCCTSTGCGVHVVAVRASGLTPLEAIIAGPDGETGAVAFGWQPPYPPAGPLVRRLMWAEAVADSLAGQAYARARPRRAGRARSACSSRCGHRLSR